MNVSVLLLLHFLVSCSPRRVQPSLGPVWYAGKALLHCVCVWVCEWVGGCACMCHFEGENLTVIKVKRPTVLVRGRGEKEGRGRWIDRG